MAIAPDRIEPGPGEHEFRAGSLIRMASWGIGASAALFLAVLAGLSESAAPRLSHALATVTGKPERIAATPRPAPPPLPVARPQPQPSQPSLEVRRLHEQVRLLAADRDRLIHRVSALERSLEEVTGSIQRQETALQKAAQQAQQAQQAQPWPPLPAAQPAMSVWADPPGAEPDTTAAIVPTLPVPPPQPEPEAARSEQAPARPAYGVDLGGGTSIERLRMLWQTLRTNEAKLLHGLRPITHVREVRRGGRTDIRLIAGPLANADDAAKLCAELLGAGRYCEPAVFHGQRLSLR
jgi:hypothetical protein